MLKLGNTFKCFELRITLVDNYKLGVYKMSDNIANRKYVSVKIIWKNSALISSMLYYFFINRRICSFIVALIFPATCLSLLDDRSRKRKKHGRFHSARIGRAEHCNRRTKAYTPTRV